MRPFIQTEYDELYRAAADAMEHLFLARELDPDGPIVARLIHVLNCIHNSSQPFVGPMKPLKRLELVIFDDEL